MLLIFFTLYLNHEIRLFILRYINFQSNIINDIKSIKGIKSIYKFNRILYYKSINSKPPPSFYSCDFNYIIYYIIYICIS